MSTLVCFFLALMCVNRDLHVLTHSFLSRRSSDVYPCSGNGWYWNRTLFPDPQGFVDWAHAQGLALALNVHPSIDTADPQYPIVQAQAGELAADSSLPPCALLQADQLHGRSEAPRVGTECVRPCRSRWPP